jgi:hypothetical protein
VLVQACYYVTKQQLSLCCHCSTMHWGDVVSMMSFGHSGVMLAALNWTYRTIRQVAFDNMFKCLKYLFTTVTISARGCESSGELCGLLRAQL